MFSQVLFLLLKLLLQVLPITFELADFFFFCFDGTMILEQKISMIHYSGLDNDMLDMKKKGSMIRK